MARLGSFDELAHVVTALRVVHERKLGELPAFLFLDRQTFNLIPPNLASYGERWYGMQVCVAKPTSEADIPIVRVA